MKLKSYLIPLERFSAYNSCLKGCLGKLGKDNGLQTRICMEEDSNGGLCNLFFVLLTHLAILIHNKWDTDIQASPPCPNQVSLTENTVEMT